MEAKAIARQARVTPTKSRQVLTLIRGKKAGVALDALRFTPKVAARVIEKVLKSAIANAEHNYGMDMDRLVIVRAYADQGPSMKRWQPVSMGRVHGYKHRTSHITVVVAER
ncbi:MAG: 50S ribosomal protein L22 [Thermovirgaceae bacterium]|nr:50S ribosomal protein L22 [Thermovirgaceae bacterium]